MSKKWYIIGIIALFVVAVKIWLYFSSDVKVWVEGTYTEQEILAKIYADIEIPCLTSFGFQFIYHPKQLKIDYIQSDENFCYTANYSSFHDFERLKFKPYNLKNIDSSFENIIFVGSKSSNGCNRPDRRNYTCIFGKKTLLGEIKFKRTEHSMPFDPSLIYITFALYPDSEFSALPMNMISNEVHDPIPLKPQKIKFGPVVFNAGI